MSAVNFNDGGPCPRRGCPRRRKQNHFACSRCWFALPHVIRTAIWAAWSLYKSNANYLPALRDCQQDAVNFWDRQEMPAK